MILRNDKGQFVKGTNYRTVQPYWDKDFMYDLYINQNMSSGDIASMYGVTSGNIQYWLRKHGISRRNTSEARKIKHWGASGDKNPMYGVRGELSPRYKGGITPPRQQSYNKSEWKTLSKIVLDRANGKCERCGDEHKRLHIHHIVPIKNGGEFLCDANKLIVLCPKCHYFIHSNNNTNKEYIKYDL